MLLVLAVSASFDVGRGTTEVLKNPDFENTNVGHDWHSNGHPTKTASSGSYHNQHSIHLLDTTLIDENVADSPDSFHDKPEFLSKAVVEFAAAQAAVLEGDGRVQLNIVRHGDLTPRFEFKVKTIDGTAESGSDYVAVKRTMVFEPGQTSLHLEIDIVDDHIWEPDEVFFVRITIETDQEAVAGRHQICQVVILNDDTSSGGTHIIVG